MTLQAGLHAAALAAAAAAVAAALTAPARADDATDAGKAVFKRANCFGCHKWHGDGGGGYGGAALSLRKTSLTRQQIIETVACGRPGTGMPFFTRGAYDSVKCYGMGRAEAAGAMPPEANVFLRPADMEAVADYVLAHVTGRGEPSFDECIAFFGSGSRVCDVYRKEPAVPPAVAATPEPRQ